MSVCNTQCLWRNASHSKLLSFFFDWFIECEHTITKTMKERTTYRTPNKRWLLWWDGRNTVKEHYNKCNGILWFCHFYSLHERAKRNSRKMLKRMFIEITTKICYWSLFRLWQIFPTHSKRFLANVILINSV